MMKKWTVLSFLALSLAIPTKSFADDQIWNSVALPEIQNPKIEFSLSQLESFSGISASGAQISASRLILRVNS